MATAASLVTAQKMVVSLLQASSTAFGATTTGSTPDSSNFQYRSDLEIQNALLTADGIVCNTIIQIPNHPYISTFIQTSSALTNGSSLPARNGAIIRITCLNGLTNYAFAALAVNTTNNTITFTDTQEVLTLGRRVQFSGGALPAPFVVSTDYYVVPSGADTKFATTYDNALAGTVIDITTTGSGGTLVLNLYEPAKQGMSIDEMTEVQQNPDVFGSEQRYVSGYGLVDGDTFYTSSQAGKVLYADYTLTSALQAAEPYLLADVAGAIGDMLVKDGSDDQMAAYYMGIFNQQLGIISQGAQVLPELAPYAR